MGLARRHMAALASGAAISVMAMALHAQAQEANADDSAATNVTRPDGRTTLLQRLVVGAGAEKVAIDTPQAVTVVDQDDLDQAQATTIGEVFDQVPGVQAIGSDRIIGQSFNIRGIGELAASDESKIIVTVDGANKFFEQYRVGSFFSDPELYKQVEVLRGPASSTLYGSGAIGGVINMTTKDAADFLDEGQRGSLRLKGAYDSNGDGLLGSAILAMRIDPQTDFLWTGNYRQANEFVNGDGDAILGSDFQSWSGLVKGTHRWGVNDEQVARLSYQRWYSEGDDSQYSQTGTIADFGTIDREVTDETVVFSYENPASDNPWLDLKFNLSWSNTAVHQDDASSPIPSALFLPGDYAYETYQMKLENTIETIGDGFSNYLTYGTQLSRQYRTAETTSGAIDFHPEGVDTKYGFYVQNEFTWNDRLTLIPGARVDFVDLRPDDSIAGASDTRETAFSPKIAALYKVTDWLSVFGSVAHTERVATLDELFSTAAGNSTYPGGRTASLSLEKETSNNFEAGFALSWSDLLQANDSIQVKTTFFQNELDNLIATNPDTGLNTPVPYYVNISRARIKGVEIEAAYDAEYYFARAAYSAIEGKNLDTGVTLNSIPSDQVSFTLGARVPDQGFEIGWKALFASAIETGATTGPYDAYQVHDAFMSWKPNEASWNGFELRASVENVFDEQYRNNLAGDDGKGRTFKLSLVKELGW